MKTFEKRTVALVVNMLKNTNDIDQCEAKSLSFQLQRFESAKKLKGTNDWEALPQAVINNAINWFQCRVRVVISKNGQHIEKY